MQNRHDAPTFPIGKNMSNEEYLGRLAEKNRALRQREQSRERQEQKKVQEREAGFNVYLGGANERRVQELRQQEKYGMAFKSGQGEVNRGGNQRQGSRNRSGSRGVGRSDSKGARRKWLAPEKEDAEAAMTEEKKQNYQNPVSVHDSIKRSNSAQ